MPKQKWSSRVSQQVEKEKRAAPISIPDDPYELLKVTHEASWDEIVASYRRLARWWHPDGLVNPAPGERELCEDMIRRLNIAYTELRVRRAH